MCAEPAVTGLIWFQPTWTASVKCTTYLVEDSIVAYWCCLSKLDADAMHQMPMMQSSIVTAKIPFVLYTNTNVILSH